jgi:hypothetical protein
MSMSERPKFSFRRTAKFNPTEVTYHVWAYGGPERGAPLLMKVGRQAGAKTWYAIDVDGNMSTWRGGFPSREAAANWFFDTHYELKPL